MSCFPGGKRYDEADCNGIGHSFSLFSIELSAELSTASSQDLLATYKQLRTIPGGSDSATVNNVVLKRDAATFTFVSGRLMFAAPIAGRVLAARFQGEGTFELIPPSNADKKHIGALVGKPQLTDSFKETQLHSGSPQSR
jgi:hypothetical protein